MAVLRTSVRSDFFFPSQDFTQLYKRFSGLCTNFDDVKHLFTLLLFFPLFLRAQTPSVASSSLATTYVYCQELELSWNSGNGSQRMVLARKSNSINNLPSDNTFYIAKDTFGIGDRLGSDIYVVYRGTGNRARVRGLEKNTTYYFAVIEFNGSGSNFQHLTSTYPEISVTTENITANFSINDDYQCLNGNQFSFTNSSSHSGSQSMTYVWDFGDLSTSTATDPTHIYSVGGVFNVRLTATTRGCVTQTTKQDTVVPVSGVRFTVRSDIDTMQCLSGNYFFFQNSTVPRSVGTSIDRTNYNWYFGDGGTATGYNAFRSYPRSGDFTVKLVTTRWVTNNPAAEGCSDSATMVVSVRPKPIVRDSVWFSDTALCLNPHEFSFDNRSPLATVHLWDFGDGSNANGKMVRKTYAAAGKYNVRLIAEDAIGCKDTLIRQVEVFSQPNNNFSGLSNRYCLNDPEVTLIPTLSGGTFYGPGTNPTNNQFRPNQVGVHEIGYVVVIGNCRDTSKQSTEVFPLPEFELGNDTMICAGSSLDLNISVAADVYSWSDGNNQQSRTVTSAGTYQARATKDGCSFSDELDLSVLQAPVVNLGGDTTICGGNGYTLNVTQPMSTYLWDNGSTTATRLVDQSGLYWVQIDNDCGTASDSVQVTVEAYSCDIFLPTAFSPNGDILNDVFAPKGNFKMIQFKIFSRWGDVLYETEGYEGWNGLIGQERYPAGVYFYELVYQVPRGGNWVTEVKAGSVHLIH